MTNKPESPFTRFQCRGCRMWLKAPPALAGSKQPCPRCQTTLVVPSGESRQPPSADGSYELWDDKAGSYADSELARQTFIPVVCRHCQTWMYGTEDQVGQRLTCPDCGVKTTVPPPPKPVAKKIPPGFALEEQDPYEVEDPIEPPSVEMLGYGEPPLDEPTTGEDEENRPDSEYVTERIRPTPPRRPFLSGVFTFPFYLSTLVRLTTLTAWAAVVFLLGMRGVEVAMQGSFAAVMGVCMFTAAAILGAIWFAVTSATMLTILQATAHGVDVVEDWPDAMFIDWMLQGLFLVTSTIASMLPGIAVAWALDYTGPAKVALTAAVSFVLYPIVLLSMLEADSPIMPWSPAILVSLLRKCWAWAIFYVETAALTIVVCGLALWASQVGPLSIGLIIVCVAMVALFIYFRLLGRLALCCGYEPVEADGGEDHPRAESDEAAEGETDD